MIQHRSSRRTVRRRIGGFFPILACLLLALATPIRADDDTTMSIDRFLLRLGPRDTEFDLQEKVTILWTIENLVREYFEDEYSESSQTFFESAGITGLSVVPPADETADYETVKILGGAVTFRSDSTATPTNSQIQSAVESALEPTVVIDRLSMYFPELTTAVFLPLELGNRGFGLQPADLAGNNDGGLSESYEKPKTPYKPSGGNQIDAAESSVSSSGSAPSNTTIGLSTGVALGGAIIVLLVGLLVKSRQRRMDSWRESGVEEDSVGSVELDLAKKPKPAIKVYTEDEQEPSLRLPRLWGVQPSQPMDSGTSPGSCNLSTGDSVQEILTCTSMDRRSLQNVESFEHQKRLVDTLKKEMMASNAEIHPYMQTTHLDNTEPCALSPTDLSAAALENQVPTWRAPSDDASSITGSGSGYDSPTSSSPLRIMMRNFQLPGMSRSRDSPYHGSEGAEF